MNNCQPTSADIQAKRRRVNKAYSEHGFPSPEYDKEFDELHDMRLKFMAIQYRRERGLPPGSKTPYD